MSARGPFRPLRWAIPLAGAGALFSPGRLRTDFVGGPCHVRRPTGACTSGWCSSVNLRMLRVRKTMRVMANHRASMAFNSWLDFLVSLEERDNLMIRVIKKIALSTQAAAFEQWRCTVEEARRQERVLIRALGKMFHRVLAQAFEAWGEKVAALHRQRGVSNRAIAKMTHRALSMAFEVRFAFTFLERTFHFSIPC